MRLGGEKTVLARGEFIEDYIRVLANKVCRPQKPGGVSLFAQIEGGVPIKGESKSGLWWPYRVSRSANFIMAD